MAGFEDVTAHMDTARGELAELTRQLYSQQINLQQWEISAASVLKDAHLSAATWARGGTANMGFVEFGRVGGAYGDELRYLDKFAQDIAAGRVSEAQALARIDQYGKAGQQAYWREYALAGKLIYWNLNPGESCGGCVELAAGSPYQRGELWTVPGAGRTPCRGSCNCTLSEEAAA
jgi:hypothetical protein